MLRQRLLVSIILLPVGLTLVHFGGLPFNLFIILVLGAAAWEYCNLFFMGSYAPATLLVTGGVVILAAVRVYFDWSVTLGALAALTLTVMTYHLLAYERGRDQAAVDFAISAGGVLYLGLIGPYLISLRAIPDGKWWFLAAIPAVWFADAGAYFIGSRFGRRKLAPRLSPKKSWEGLYGGIISSIIATTLLAAIWHIAAPDVTFWKGALIGLVMSVLTPLGDLGESMLKRQFGVKDSSHILPGHGGVLDRIDSWLWGGVIGYYLITLLW